MISISHWGAFRFEEYPADLYLRCDGAHLMMMVG
jgi:hypothetical protein